MPCVYKRGRTWWGRFTMDGQEHRRSLHTRDEGQAKLRLTDWLEEVAALRPANPIGLDVWTATGVLGHVYALGYANRVKIGWTGVDPDWRRVNLQPTYPETLVLFGSSPGHMHDEKALHAQFAKHRIRGEWFLREGLVAAWIDAGCPAQFEVTASAT